MNNFTNASANGSMYSLTSPPREGASTSSSMGTAQVRLMVLITFFSLWMLFQMMNARKWQFIMGTIMCYVDILCRQKISNLHLFITLAVGSKGYYKLTGIRGIVILIISHNLQTALLIISYYCRIDWIKYVNVEIMIVSYVWFEIVVYFSSPRAVKVMGLALFISLSCSIAGDLLQEKSLEFLAILFCFYDMTKLYKKVQTMGIVCMEGCQELTDQDNVSI
ncbi:MAG: hypothetical protein ACRC31_04895 [Cetobacterium sp.]